MEELKELIFDIPEDVPPVYFYGPNDLFINVLSEQTECRIVSRGSRLKIIGKARETEAVLAMCEEMIALLRKKKRVTAEDIRTIVHVHSLPAMSENVPENRVAQEIDNQITTVRKTVYAKTEGQREVIRSVQDHDLTFVIGPAGTGKTYIAVALAVHYYIKGFIKKIILTRPAVEAGESLGYLPGDFKEKIDPYLKPLYDALEDMLPRSQLKNMFEEQIIEIIPLAYMRGRTLNNAFVILDEAQNTTFTQMKMFLTRLGHHTKAMVTGDVTQVDLDHRKESGLITGLRVLRAIEQIKVVYFNREDVVRHPLVKKIIDAYDAYDADDEI
ncbi:MAG: PhoH family protein [Calditrichaeota bacterium]|nr:MAG: PhoH family protein [Calditrichota bacterium]